VVIFDIDVQVVPVLLEISGAPECGYTLGEAIALVRAAEIGIRLEALKMRRP
jgi:hypothetical protein